MDSLGLVDDAGTIIRNALAAVQNPNQALIDKPIDDILHFDSLLREDGITTPDKKTTQFRV